MHDLFQRPEIHRPRRALEAVQPTVQLIEIVGRDAPPRRLRPLQQGADDSDVFTMFDREGRVQALAQIVGHR